MADPRPAGRPDPRPPVQAVGGTRHPGRGPILSFTGEGQDQVPGAWAQRCGPGRLCETPVMAVDEAPRARSTRMTGRERREQLVSVGRQRSEEHTSELQSRGQLVCRLLPEKKKPLDVACRNPLDKKRQKRTA